MACAPEAPEIGKGELGKGSRRLGGFLDLKLVSTERGVIRWQALAWPVFVLPDRCLGFGVGVGVGIDFCGILDFEPLCSSAVSGGE